MKPLVILPTYNESENLRAFVAEVFSVLTTHILVIDDHSPDGTGQLAELLSVEHPTLSVLHRPKKMGLGSAYVQGFRWALERDYDVIVQMDSDFSHDPHSLPKMLEALSKADLVLGSRYILGGRILDWPKSRLAVSAFGGWYARTILGLSVRDLTGGFKVFRRKVIEALDLDHILSDGYAFQIETTFRTIQKGFKVTEIPITFRDRTRGVSKISKKVFLEAVGIVWRLKK